MSSRPLAFGIRFRDKGRTLRVRPHERQAHRFLVEDSREGRETRRREHPSLCAALRDFAESWRQRLH